MAKNNHILQPAPTDDPSLKRRFSDFSTLVEALEYAAKGVRGINFYSSRGELQNVVTYSEFQKRAEDIGRRLVGLGFEKGDRLALIAETGADFIAFFLGAQYASVLPVPLPLPTSFGGREGYVEQLARQMKSCGAKGLIGPEHMAELYRDAAIRFDMLFVGSADEFMATTTKSGDVRLPEPKDIAYLQYSSGSTRFPHGIAVTHESLLANTHGMGYHGVQVREGDRCASWLPFYHDMGLVGTFLTALTCQVTCDYLATEDFARRPLMWLSLISRNKCTLSYSPTFGYDICARRISPDAMANLDLSSWRCAGIGGDMIRADVMKFFAKTFGPAGFKATNFVPSYGLAECTLAVSFMPLDKGIIIDKVDERVLAGEIRGSHAGRNGKINGIAAGTTVYRDVVNCGKPLPEYDIEIRDENGNSLASRCIGRVFVRGKSVMKEYFADPEATNAVLSKEGWLDTGDMGYMLDGHLYIIGRAKDMIIVNGRNHWPQDIEWAAEQLPGLRNGDIAAISIPGPDSEEVPTVLVQCRIRDSEERLQFKENVRAAILKSTGVHCQIELVPPRTLPRTSSGKLSRAKARQQFLSGGIPQLLH